MAPFNQRQIGYIQAIAGRQQHTTLICGQRNDQLNSDTTGGVANRPKTLKTDHVLGLGLPVDNIQGPAKTLMLHTWFLDAPTLVFDSLATRNNDKLEPSDFTSMEKSSIGWGPVVSLNAFEAPCKGSHKLMPDGSDAQREVQTVSSADGELVRNPDFISSIHRATPDGFLNSTDLKVRFTLPGQGHDADASLDNPMGQDHYEFRWIVWRNKRPTIHHAADTDGGHSSLEAIRDGKSFRNPAYDFFMGQTGRKRGFLGYTRHAKMDTDKDPAHVHNTEIYSGYLPGSDDLTNTSSGALATGGTEQENGANNLWPEGEDAFTVDDLLTMPINRDDYVVMKDVRFFLGKEHGKSHFEDRLHWDWNDPIDTLESNVLSSPTLNDKNYRWMMTLIGTNGGRNRFLLNNSMRWTTKMESG